MINLNFNSFAFTFMIIINYRVSRAILTKYLNIFSPLFFGFAESRLKPSHQSAFFPSGDFLIRNDRTLRRSGEVALLYRHDFVLINSHRSSELPLLFSSISPIEFLASHFLHHTLGIVLVIVVYRPPRSVSYLSLFKEVDELLAVRPGCVLMRNFNYRLGGLDTFTGVFLDHLLSLGFSVLRNSHTYVDCHGSSKLDLIAFFHSDLVRHKTGNLCVSGRHILFFCEFESQSLISLSLFLSGLPRSFQNYSANFFLARSGGPSVGHDGIHMRRLLDGLPILALILSDLPNSILFSGCYPALWKKILVKPTSKVLNPTSCSQYCSGCFRRIFGCVQLHLR